jgi:hypothetical protein
MHEPIHLNVFDFDETLFRVPNYTVSEAKGKEPYEWFDSADSLDSKFGIRGIANTVSKTREPGALNILVTHRVKRCQERVLQILAESKIQFDSVFFLGRTSSKALTVMKEIEGSRIETITIYEDSLWQIISYVKEFEEAKISQDVNFAFVDKSKIIHIDWQTALNITNTVTHERLKLI